MRVPLVGIELAARSTGTALPASPTAALERVVGSELLADTARTSERPAPRAAGAEWREMTWRWGKPEEPGGDVLAQARRRRPRAPGSAPWGLERHHDDPGDLPGCGRGSSRGAARRLVAGGARRRRSRSPCATGAPRGQRSRPEARSLGSFSGSARRAGPSCPGRPGSGARSTADAEPIPQDRREELGRSPPRKAAARSPSRRAGRQCEQVGRPSTSRPTCSGDM